jgi:hypothetical protein
MNHFFKAAATAGLILVQSSLAFAGNPLGPAELRSLVPGRFQVTLMGVSNIIITLRSNGSMQGTAKSQSDTGHWNLSGNKICIAWNKWLGGQAHCSSLVLQGSYFQGSGFTIRRI